MTRFSHFLLAAGLLSLTAGAFAQPPGPPPTGGPGAPERARAPETRADLKARLEARFDRMDANHDGKIDAKDAEARHEQRIAAMFDRLDTDKNGTLSKAEFAIAEERREEHMGPPRFGRMGGPGRAMLFHRGGPGGEGRMMMRGPLPFAPPPGRPGEMRRGFPPGGHEGKPREPLTRSDFVDRGLARFDRIDTNHDGKISPAERDAARGPRHFRERPKTPASPQATPKPGQ